MCAKVGLYLLPAMVLSICVLGAEVSGEVEPECRTGEDCSFRQACIDKRCKYLCQENNPCKSGHTCEISSHRTALCRCPDGWPVKDDGECYGKSGPCPECFEMPECNIPANEDCIKCYSNCWARKTPREE